MSDADEPSEEEAAFSGDDPWSRVTRGFLGIADTPAYLRRSLAVQDALQGVLNRCERHRDGWFDGVRLHLRAWNALVAQNPAVEAALSADDQAALNKLNEIVFGVEKQCSRFADGRPAQVLHRLAQSLERFERRWTAYTAHLTLDGPNRLIDGYNRHYLFEKECAFRSPRLARLGYEPLPPLTVEWVRAGFPPLPILAGGSVGKRSLWDRFVEWLQSTERTQKNAIQATAGQKKK
ncbi:MAG: hypothetical protein ACRC1K_19070 [Planctomycetia bacterium]